MNIDINAILNDAVNDMPVANIIVIGKTGVGKSSLINSVFRGNFAETGVGKSVTDNIKVIKKVGVPLQIIDTQGLEVADYEKTRLKIESYINENNNSELSENYVHLAWLCISDTGKRYEEAEINLAKYLVSKGIPIIVVLTKTNSFRNNEFADEVRKVFKAYSHKVCAIRALEEIIYDEDDADEILGVRKIKGIDELIQASYEVIPSAQKKAFSNALSIKNKKALDIKKEQAEKEVLAATALAAAAAAAPVPFSDAFTLVPIQIGMIAKISYTFGMDVSKTALTTMVTSLVGAGSAVFIGRTVVTGLLKMIPGIGTVVGGAISATTASAITKVMGDAYVLVLYTLATESETGEIDFELAANLLKSKVSF
ncbi:GTP-binding protein Der [Raoultella terrigena]|uniref:GTP-binding protein Der n=1 Tax=Raoultella terrigena TaxID=577 RepID=A0A3P8KS36_RAOTE|nr:GTP-binding protein Der [Raoultella terrigena]